MPIRSHIQPRFSNISPSSFTIPPINSDHFSLEVTDDSVKIGECNKFSDGIDPDRSADTNMSIEAKPEDGDANHTAPDAPFQLEDQRALLCHNCAQLDFGKIQQEEVQNEEGDHVIDLEDRSSLLASTCPLCQLFGATVEEYPGLHLRAYRSPLGAPGETRYNVLGVSSKNIFDTMLSLYGNGHLAIESSQNDTRLSSTKLVNPGAFNLDIARQCWEYCSSNHVATCGRTNAHHSYPFKVIDCFSRTIIDAPKHCQYVALSYVWGNVSSTAHMKSSNCQKNGLSLSNLPRTIEDSISVTLGMSLRYLWIDRYCINQSDHGAKDLQIKQMDTIYSLAELTIIAAAGTNPHHGLPGINGTWRNPQQKSIRLGEYCIRQMLPPAIVSLSRSTWADRAWTYQEFILSRRRLIFTSAQVFYECQEMLCSESRNVSLDTAMLMYSRECWNDPLDPIYIPQKTAPELKGGISSVWDCIEEYSKRRLSFYEDTLNAMRGILEAVRKGNQPVHHLSGLPVLEPGVNLDATQQLLINLDWCHKTPSERVTTLPSWSWAGWYTHSLCFPPLMSYVMHPLLGSLTDDTEAASYLKSLDNEDFKGAVWIENQGSLIEYPSDKESAVELLTSLDDIRFIHIRTWVIPCRTAIVKGLESLEYSVTLMFKQYEITEHTTRLSREMTASDLERFRQERGSLLGMVLPKVDGQDGMFVLLVEEMGEHYERLGCIDVEDGVDDKGVEYKWTDLGSEPKRTIRLG